MIGGDAMTEPLRHEAQVNPIAKASEARARVKFGKNNEFQAELRRRVDEYFERTGRPRRDVPKMYLKTAILFGTFTLAYVLLVFFAQTWWQAFPLAILLGLTTAEIGFNIQHDGGHEA